jgi:hypothetical protein
VLGVYHPSGTREKLGVYHPSLFVYHPSLFVSLLPSTNSEPFTPGIHAKREIARLKKKKKKKKRGYRVCSSGYAATDTS